MRQVSKMPVTTKEGLWERIAILSERLFYNYITTTNLFKMSDTDVSKTEHSVVYKDNRDGTYTLSTSGKSDATTECTLGPAVTFKQHHVYYIGGAPEGAGLSTYYLYFHSGTGLVDTGGGTVIDRGNYATYSHVPKIKVDIGVTITTPVVFRPQVYDLTEVFGAGHEPKTVAEFLAYAHEGEL